MNFLNRKTVEDIDVTGKRVLVRCDYNVPFDSEGNITDTKRIDESIKTLRYLIDHNAKVIICSHRGRPKGTVKPELSLAPTIPYLSKVLGQQVKMAADVVGESAKTLCANLQEGQVMMLENVRRCVTDNDIQGIKLHLLHLMTNTRMQRDYHEGRLKLLSQEEYVSIICDQLEIIPKDIVIHRITGDAPRDMLIGPMWSLNKWEVLNAIDKEMERRDSWQGCKVASEQEEKA